MGALFNEVLYRPFINALVFLYETIALHDLGIAIILLTLLIRLILFPLFQKAMRHQRIAQELQPHVKKIQEKHKNDKEAQAKAVFDLYGKHNVNPFTPFLLLLVQLPILFALYKVFRNVGEGTVSFDILYSFVPSPEVLAPSFLGILDLAQPSAVLTVIAALAQFVQSKLTIPAQPKGGKEDTAAAIGRNMMYIGPLLTLFILWSFPAAIGVYWLTTTIFSIIQQKLINKALKDEGIGADN